MQVSKQQINRVLERQLAVMLYQVIADIKNQAEAETILRQLLSKTELLAVIKRLGIGYWLSKKRSYEIIKENLKVSSATIATIQRDLDNPGWQTAMKKVMAEEWATKWEQKIKQWIKRSKS